MALITPDIHIRGKHARMIKELISKKVYSEGNEVFIDACLVGLYHGQKSEMDVSTGDTVTVSRTIWPKRSELENALFVFLQHEKVLSNEPIETAEVFNMNLQTNDTRELLRELIEYSYYGIEKLHEEYAELNLDSKIEDLIQFVESNTLYKEEELFKTVQELIKKQTVDNDDKKAVEELMNLTSFNSGG